MTDASAEEWINPFFIFWFFLSSLAYVFLRRDRKLKRIRAQAAQQSSTNETESPTVTDTIYGSKLEKHIERISRISFIFSGVIIVGSPALCTSAFFTGTSFDAYEYFRRDMMAIINSLHGGILMSFFSQFNDTGNPRYVTITICMILCTLVPACTEMYLAYHDSLWHHGNELVVTPELLFPIIFAMFGFMALAGQCYTRRKVLNCEGEHLQAKFPYGKQLRENDALLRNELSDYQFSDLKWWKKCVFICLFLELCVFIAQTILAGVFRVKVLSHWSQDDDMSSAVFMGNFVNAYTFALHVGFLLGNGCDAVLHNNKGSLDLFTYAKFVFGILTWFETLVLIYQFVHHNSDGLAVSMWLNIMWSGVQTFTFISVYYVRDKFKTIPALAEHQFIPVLSDSVSAGFGSVSLHSFVGKANQKHLSYYTRNRIKRANNMSYALLFVFHLESLCTVALSPTVEAMDAALSFSLHAVVLFCYSHYIIMQNPARIPRRRAYQFYLCLMYLVITLFELVAIAVGSSAESDPHVHRNTHEKEMIHNHRTGILCFIAFRILVCLSGAYVFRKMKFFDNNTAALKTQSKVVFIRLCCCRWSWYDQSKPVVVHQATENEKLAAEMREMELISKAYPDQKKVVGADSTQDFKLLRSGIEQRDEVNDESEDDDECDESKVMIERKSADWSDDDDKGLLLTENSVHHVAEDDIAVGDQNARDMANLAMISSFCFIGGYVLLDLAFFNVQRVQSTDVTGRWMPSHAEAFSDSHYYKVGAETITYSLTFHFCFFVTGYALRGLKTLNVLFLKVVAWASLTSVTLCVAMTVSGLLQYFDITGDEPEDISMEAHKFFLIAVMVLMCLLIAHFYLVHSLIKYVEDRLALGLFPQNAFAFW